MGGLMRFGELEEQFAQISDTTIEEKIPFLQMLQCIEPTFTRTEPNQILQSLLQIQTLEPESCLTLETTIKRDPGQTDDPEKDPRTENGAAATVVKEKRKRKRTRAPKNKDDVENQRMTHIAVERNRRRQMNQHLTSLRSLMPPSFLQRGDQASIVGGAIDFIKELEQLLQSLEAEKRNDGTNNETPKTASSTSSSSRACTNNSSVSSVSTTASEDRFTAKFGGRDTAEVEATVIQNHASLKVRCKRGKGQILRAIVSIEDLKLAILHLTISSSFDFVFYSFNLKIEDGCQLGSADEIATAVHKIFEQINGERMWSNLRRIS